MIEGEHDGVKYKEVGSGVWYVTYPSGHKGHCQAETEEELKAKISELKQKMGG